MNNTIVILMLSLSSMLVSCSTEKNAQPVEDKPHIREPSPVVKVTEFTKSEEVVYEGMVSGFARLSTDEWGIGILSDRRYNQSETLNFPDTTIDLYGEPDGAVIGMVSRLPGYGLLFRNYQDSTARRINREDFKEVTYEGNNLKYYQDEGGFVKCFIHSLDSGGWVKKEDLEKNNFTPVNWKDFLIGSKRMMHPPNRRSLLLYDSTGTILDSLKYGEFELLLLDREENGLIKVEIYNPSLRLGGDSEKVRNAWIELIDKNGHPNVFYFARGC